jgi:vacuolar protein sorting-associated protein 35
MSYQEPIREPGQDQWLEDAMTNTTELAFSMKRALDQSDIREALKCAVTMLGELRTSQLSPKNYYELYMEVTGHLRELEVYFEDEDSAGGRSVVELYETVQHVGNIVPRMYLLITVGSVYIKSRKAPAKDILFDLVELCRGVQHPARGLFLRDYLSSMAKDKLPDAGSEYEGTGGSAADAIEFILQNFGEMNKLWVRMQHQGAVRDRERREEERRNLRQLIGVNLVRLSELEGVDMTTYESTVLPRILEQVVNCKDLIAQEYLMEVVIQVFADDFHLKTLEKFLSTLPQLQKNVNVKNIIVAMMNRLANYAQESPDSIPSDLDMFPLFHKYSAQVIESKTQMALEDVLDLQVALVNFASTVYPETIHYVDHVLGYTVQVLEKTSSSNLSHKCINFVRQLLTLPLKSLGLNILELDSYAAMMNFLGFEERKAVAVSIMDAVIETDSQLDSVEKVEKLFSYISPVLKDQEDGKGLSDDNRYDFDREQSLSARLFHQIRNDDTDEHFRLYVAVRKHFGQGGSDRIQYSLPPLVYGCLALVKRIRAREEDKDAEEQPQAKPKKVFGFVHEIITALSSQYPELALRLFLHAAKLSDELNYEAIAYEFVVQAFLVYEDEISDSKQQFAAIGLVTTTLQTLVSLSEESYDTLITKATLHSAKLIKKPDQCRAVLRCSNLFWQGTDETPGHRDAKRVLECLQRSLKIANSCMGHQVNLFVDILNQYLYFYERQCPTISLQYLRGLIALIQEHISSLDDSDVSVQAQKYYENTLRHITIKSRLDGDQAEQGARYAAILADDEE